MVSITTDHEQVYDGLFLVVVNFARKTGDLAYLSAVDIKIMALTYQLTCEQEPVKIAQLKKQPSREVITVPPLPPPKKQQQQQQQTNKQTKESGCEACLITLIW